MRILVTGSRDWADRDMIYRELDQLWDLASGRFVLVHGANPTRTCADQIAQEWADSRHGVKVERHQADWSGPCRPSCAPGHRRGLGFDAIGYCPAAGVYRNTEMVAAGADVCVAFIKDNSRGATDCADKAEAAGIPTRRHTA